MVLSRSAPNLSGDEIDRLSALSGGSAGFALKIARAEALPLVDEMLAMIGAFPTLDVPRLHKLAEQISRKADAESFEVLRTMLLDRVRDVILQGARSGEASAFVERSLQLQDRLTNVFNMADKSNLDRKLAFIRAISEVRDARI